MIPRAILSRAFSSTFTSKTTLLNACRLPQRLRSFPAEQTRNIYTEDSLGLNKIQENTKKTRALFGQQKGLFFSQFQELLADPKSPIQEADFKNIILLASTPEEVSILRRSIVHFGAQIKDENRLQEFKFGPYVLRAAHLINDPSIAMMLMDKQNIEFFKNVTSVGLAMSLLYKNQRFQEVIALFQFVRDNYKFNTPVIYFMDIVFASAYQLNTPEAFDDCLKIIRQLRKTTKSIDEQAFNLFLSLSLRQNRPKTALEIMDLYEKQQGRGPLQFKFMAYADLLDFDTFIRISNFVLNAVQNTKKPTRKLVFTETLDYLEKRLMEIDNEELKKTFAGVKEKLVKNNLVENEKTIESILFSPKPLYKLSVNTSTSMKIGDTNTNKSQLSKARYAN